jgi:hypothetical protein
LMVLALVSDEIAFVDKVRAVHRLGMTDAPKPAIVRASNVDFWHPRAVPDSRPHG